MMCLRSTTSRVLPALIRSVSRSPNALAVLLSIRPLISTIVISPACCSAISIVPLHWQSLHYFNHVMSAHPHIAYLVHQGFDEMHAQTADPSRLNGSIERRIGGFARVE